METLVAQQPLLVLTDHKNLQYICTAKRLNPRQAQWSLFFTRFNFTLSYRPGSKDGKADALSRMDNKEDKKECEETIFSSTSWINGINWDFNVELNNTYHTPEECLAEKKYVPP